MKEIKATIRPHMMDKVMQGLHALEHFPGLTLFRCQGQGRGRGAGGAFVLTEADIDSRPAIRIEIVCADSAADAVVRTIVANGHTGIPGDGIITVSDVNDVVRIRTGESGDQAL